MFLSCVYWFRERHNYTGYMYCNGQCVTTQDEVRRFLYSLLAAGRQHTKHPLDLQLFILVQHV